LLPETAIDRRAISQKNLGVMKIDLRAARRGATSDSHRAQASPIAEQLRARIPAARAAALPDRTAGDHRPDHGMCESLTGWCSAS
jgi:hypothetical protein